MKLDYSQKIFVFCKSQSLGNGWDIMRLLTRLFVLFCQWSPCCRLQALLSLLLVSPRGSLFTWYTGCCWLTTDIRKLIQLYQDKLTTAQDGKTVILSREPIIDLFLDVEIYFDAQCSNSPFSCYSMRQARWPLGLTELSSSQNRYILPSQRILDTDLTLTTSLVRSWPCCCPPVPCADFDQLYQFFLHFWSDIFVVFHFSNIH